MVGLRPDDDRWSALLRATRSWRLIWNTTELVNCIAKDAAEVLQANQIIIYLLEQSGLKSRACWPATLNSTLSDDFCLRLASRVTESGRPIFAHDLDRSPEAEQSSEAGTIICVPLTATRGILGAIFIELASKQTPGFTSKDQEFVEMLGLQSAAALEHAILYYSAITDPLTGLFTHRHFQQEVEQAVRRAVRSEEAVSLILLDLDHFKELNDTCGHDVGNKCLVELAALLRTAVRGSDAVARFGGDEFEILLHDAKSSAALGVAEKIRLQISASPFGREHKITGTIGVAAFPENALDGQALFLRADEALYRAKEAGRNQCICSSAVPAPDGKATVGPDVVPLVSKITPQLVPSPTPDAALELSELGEQVDGHAILRRLGTGSTGEVLLVRQPGLDREVALKRPLTPHLTAQQNEAFEREAKVTSRLSHPGVIAVYNLGRDADGRRYYTMKHLGGSSLAENLEARRNGNATPTQERLLEILQRVAETVAYAHNQDVLHLDLTPSNVMVGDFGEVTVIDWGSGASRRVSLPERASSKESRRLSLVLGSPLYLAPEYVNRSRLGPAADVYSLGSILYEILTGRPPHFLDDTRKAVSNLIGGIITPPELANPDARIDAALSRLCMNAMELNPADRPTARDFAERLGRYVRNENEWIVTRFGSGQTPVSSNDWQTASGSWEVNGEECISRGDGENIIAWKTEVPGPFRVSFEGWVDQANEISFIARRTTCEPAVSRTGYLFQFGAEYSTCTRLLRMDSRVHHRPGMVPELRRRYRIDVTYEDGQLQCSIDQKRVFAYRELFELPGSYIGFYCYGPGVHSRPLEVQRYWTMTVPLMRVADNLFQHELFADALASYRELAQRAADRTEGLAAQLKIGMCNVLLGRPDEARKCFRTLEGTALEPLALAEEIRLDLQQNDQSGPDDNLRRVISLLSKLRARFPGTQAEFRATEYISSTPSVWSLPRKNAIENLELVTELWRMGSRAEERPTRPEIICSSYRARALIILGKREQALQELLVLREKLKPAQQNTGRFQPTLVSAALANGRDDLLPGTPFELFDWDIPHAHWSTGIILHCVLRRGNAADFLKSYLEDGRRVHTSCLRQNGQAVLLLYLAQKKSAEAGQFLATEQFAVLRNDPWNWYNAASALIEAGDEALYTRFVELYLPQQNWHLFDLLQVLKVRRAVDAGDLGAGGAACLNLDLVRLTDAGTNNSEGLFVMQVTWHAILLHSLLVSLGRLRGDREQLNALARRFLAGPDLHLHQIFMGEAVPVPNELWPHRQWRPELRLWLGLWLEARGDVNTARQIVEPAIDQRYGFTHCQPALLALLRRLS